MIDIIIFRSIHLWSLQTILHVQLAPVVEVSDALQLAPIAISEYLVLLGRPCQFLIYSELLQAELLVMFRLTASLEIALA